MVGLLFGHRSDSLSPEPGFQLLFYGILRCILYTHSPEFGLYLMTLLHDFFFTDDANLPPHVIANPIFCISPSYAQIFDLQTWQNLLSVEYQVIARWEDGAV